MLLAQISDLHIRAKGEKLYDFIDTNQMIAKHIATLNNLKNSSDIPDGIIVSGDITNCGREDEYEMAARILGQSEYKLYLIPGNHDGNEGFLKHLAPLCPYLEQVEKGKSQNIHYCVEDLPIRFIFLDSSIDGCVHGGLGGKQLEWLESKLKENRTKETAIVMHHHPFLSGHAHMDMINCKDGDKLLTIINKYQNVKRIICGHTHRIIMQNINHFLICTAPSAAHQVPFSSTDINGSYSLEPPAMLMHSYLPETGFVTYANSLADFAGPFPFDSALSCPK